MKIKELHHQIYDTLMQNTDHAVLDIDKVDDQWIDTAPEQPTIYLSIEGIAYELRAVVSDKMLVCKNCQELYEGSDFKGFCCAFCANDNR